MAPAAKGKVLVIRGGAIGDFVLTLPVLAALRRQFPNVHLEVLGYPRVTPLALAGGVADRVESIEARALASFFAKHGPLPEGLSEYFASFGLIISYLYDPDLIFQENVARCSKAQFILGPHRPNEDASLHATDAFLRPLERLAIFDADPRPKLDLPAGRLNQASQGLAAGAKEGRGPAGARPEVRLALHPGSGSESKNWPQAKWQELVRGLVQGTHGHFVLVGGEAEGDRLENLAAFVPPERRTVVRSIPLVELALLLQSCDVFVGHDSGISHLAAALGVAGVILWGPSKLHIWRPRSERMKVLQADGGVAAIEVADVLERIRAEWPGPG